MEDIDDLVNELNSMPTKEKKKKNKKKAAPVQEEPPKQEEKPEPTPPPVQSNDDLLEELGSMPEKEKKKKNKKKAPKEPEPEPEPKEQKEQNENNNNEPPQSNDDVKNEPEPPTKEKKKKKKKGKKNQYQYDFTDDVDNEPENTNKEEPEKKEEDEKEKPNNNVNEEKKEEPKEETKEEQKEESKEQAKAEDNKEEDAKDDDKEQENKPKKKKIVKKVVKKKGKEDTLLIKMLQEKKKKEKELEEQMIREQAERERKEKEEEERRLKEEEEERLRLEAEKLEKEKRLAHIKELGLNVKEMAQLEDNKKKTVKMLQDQYGQSLDQFLESLKDQPQYKKKKVKKDENKEKEKVDNEEKNDNKELEEENKENENENKNINQNTGAGVNINKQKAVNKEIEGEIEDDKKFTVNENNEDIEDWENEVDDEDEEKEKEENKNEDQEKEENNEDKEEDKIENVQISNVTNLPMIQVEEDEQKTKDDDEGKTDKSKSSSKEGKLKIEARKKKANSKMNLRSPIVCILGHVDTGKTKILDKLRRTNVQLGEAGGITQQIGATFLPISNFKEHFKKLKPAYQQEPKIPGILLIDTPGHASFQNLRSRGSSLCDIAVLIINVMKGVEKQTLESLELLRQRKTPFIIALNQIDRVYQWNSVEWNSYKNSYDRQKSSQKKEFNDLINQNITQLIKNNLNTCLYDENKNMSEYVNLVPTSAITGEGLPDLVGLLTYLSQKYLYRKIEFREEVQCTILEVKVLEGIGTTIDVILVNGTLNVGDKIIVAGLFGPIKTQIKIILTPHPMKEMRVKCEYDRHDQIKGAIGVKLFCPELENALAGSPLYVYKNAEEEDIFEKEITRDFNSIVKDFLSKTGQGIMVQASTLGSLEAILTYLHEQKINVSVVGVGNLMKKDVIKMQTIHSQQENPLKEDLVILSFDNKINPEAQQFADANGIKIFNDDVIYHLFDAYIAYKTECINERKKEKEKEAVFPCILKIVLFINKKDPLIVGVDVVEGILKVGTPIYCPDKKLYIGVVEGMEKDHKPIDNVRKDNGSVSIRLKVNDSSLAAGRHFDEKCTFVSQISRASIDALKQYFRDDMTNDDWKTVIKLKKTLEIV